VPGAGKTTALKALILSGAWRQRFDVVIVFMYTRDLIDDFAQGLRSGLKLRNGGADGQDVFLPGLEPTVYPSLQDAPCGPSPLITGLVGRGLGMYAQNVICKSGCEHYKTCAWATQREARRFQKADVILAPAALLKLNPNLVTTWADGRRVLVIDDEASGANKGFIESIRSSNLCG